MPQQQPTNGKPKNGSNGGPWQWQKKTGKW